MTVGRTPPLKSDVDNQAASFVISLDSVLRNGMQFKSWLDGALDSDLTTMGYSANDIANLRSTYTDFAALYQVWIGAGTLTPARDLRTFAKRIWGTGL